VACGFWKNRSRNLPIGSGLMLVFSAVTGFPEAILLDNGYLTELRTGAAGAVAAKYMARENIEQVGLFGAGSQGRFQIEALSEVRSFKRLMVYDHHPANIERYMREMQSHIRAEIIAAKTPEEAANDSDIVITTTPARSPVILPQWIKKGSHITAVGSDGPDKQELDAGVLAKADRIVADSIVQCLQFGELHHAVDQGAIQREEIDGEIGDVIAGVIPGRLREDEITVCDLTGVGVQDAAIARLVYHNVSQRNGSDQP
jgi:ornithine cyclodeaminase/alanine dehydrogenase-like protein (mu-crystallin family)